MVYGGRRTTDGGRTDAGAWVYYKLSGKPNGSGEIIKQCERTIVLISIFVLIGEALPRI